MKLPGADWKTLTSVPQQTQRKIVMTAAPVP